VVCSACNFMHFYMLQGFFSLYIYSTLKNFIHLNISFVGKTEDCHHAGSLLSHALKCVKSYHISFYLVLNKENWPIPFRGVPPTVVCV
jgi:hypothetical protein